MSLKDAHVLRVEKMLFKQTQDRKGQDRLEIQYYDVDANVLKEYFYLDSKDRKKAFYFNFIRMHNRLPEKSISVNHIEDVLNQQLKFRTPLFVIARKKKHFWMIREKIFESF